MGLAMGMPGAYLGLGKHLVDAEELIETTTQAPAA
jgi:hypothetical protein